MAAAKRKNQGNTATAPGGGTLDEVERARIRAVVETIWAMRRAGREADIMSMSDYWSEVLCNADEGETGRRLAKRLGIPFALLVLIDAGAASPTPAELEEWMAWPGREAVPEYTAAGADQ